MIVMYILSNVESILSVIFLAIYQGVCVSFIDVLLVPWYFFVRQGHNFVIRDSIHLTHPCCDDCEYMCSLFYHHQQIGRMTHLSLFELGQ